MERVTFTYEQHPSGQWIGTSPEKHGIVIAERTLPEALEQTAIVLRAISSPLSLDDPCPQPDVPGWSMRDCFNAHRCACARGVALGYTPTTMPV